jgi:hypothetical protein
MPDSSTMNSFSAAIRARRAWSARSSAPGAAVKRWALQPSHLPSSRGRSYSRLGARLQTEVERDALEALLHANPRLTQGYQLKTRVQALKAERDLPALELWLQAADTPVLPAFQAVDWSLRRHPSRPDHAMEHGPV